MKHWQQLIFLPLGTLLVCAFSGCMVGPDFKTPPPTTAPATMPESWTRIPQPDEPSDSPTTVPATQASVTNDLSPDVTRWWDAFNDATLNSLIDRAIQSNLDLKQAEARIRQARAQRAFVASALWPTVDTNGSYDHAGTGASGSKNTDLYRAGLDATWELDIFGGTRRAVESAEADIQVAIEDRRDVLVTLTSEVALNYMD